MRVLALDASTKTGWALFVDGQLAESGELAPIKVENFNVQDRETQKKPEYPWNVIEAAVRVGHIVCDLVVSHFPVDVVVIENTNKGKNRHTQRLLEFIHLEILHQLDRMRKDKALRDIKYMDTSEWRSIVGLWMSKDDKKNNRDVSAGKKRGKVTKKHLAVRLVNEMFGKKLKLKQNDQADAILMGLAYVKSVA
jgi:hypothetical protein